MSLQALERGCDGESRCHQTLVITLVEPIDRDEYAFHRKGLEKQRLGQMAQTAEIRSPRYPAFDIIEDPL